jgi:multicomponent Na+:H+ antiporter subunit D
MAAAALIALSKQNLRERLAYTMMSQSAAVAVSALIADPVGTFAAALQIVAQSCAATTLVMTAATAFAASGRERAVDYVGLGRAMPWTFAAFAVAAASLIGLPPFAGAWAKLWLIYSAAHAGLAWAGGLIALAAAVMFAVWGPLAAGALGGRAPDNPFRRADGASILMIAPATAAAAITVMLLFFADPIARFLSVVWRGGAP